MLKYWFTFEASVSRRDYLRHGAGLMALKYGVDVLLVLAATGNLWTPLDYFRSPPFLIAERFGGAAPFLAPALAAWTLPFLWIGVSMTIRRLLDADWSVWWALVFFVPLLNYVLIAVLSLAPGATHRRPSHAASDGPAPDGPAPRLPSALLSIALGSLFGLAMLLLAVRWLESYGLALFMGTPFAIGLITAYVLCRRYPASPAETIEVVLMTILVTVGAGLVIGVEGAVCFAMAAPLGLAIAWMGGVVGRFIANVGAAPGHGAVLIAVLLPGGAAVETGEPVAALREVTTSVIIDAAPADVWDHVIAFPPMTPPRSLLFRLGVAYPVSAEIRGSGVGARFAIASSRRAPSSSRSPPGSRGPGSRSTSSRIRARSRNCRSEPRRPHTWMATW